MHVFLRDHHHHHRHGHHHVVQVAGYPDDSGVSE